MRGELITQVIIEHAFMVNNPERVLIESQTVVASVLFWLWSAQIDTAEFGKMGKSAALRCNDIAHIVKLGFFCLSFNAGALDMQVEIDFFISAQADLQLVESLLREAAVSSRYVYLDKPVKVLFKGILSEKIFCTRARLKACVLEVIYEKTLQSDVTERIHLALTKHKIPGPLQILR